MDLIELMKKEMLRRKYSLRTIKTYVDCLNKFLLFCKKEPRKITKKDIKDYLDNLQERNKTGSTINVHLNALKFAMEEILNKNFMVRIKYSKTPKTLPTVLTQEEVTNLINSIENRKHNLMIKLLYGAGLRVSELVNLKVNDLEFENNYGFVRHGKGNKDRLFIIAESIKEELLNYVKDNKLESDNYLFESYNGHISTRTIQEITKKAAKKAKIIKNVHPHTLRHSYATHLIENGYDVYSVQSLLGHNSAQTTRLYVHIASPKMIGVKSPLDALNLNKMKDLQPIKEDRNFNYESENFSIKSHINQECGRLRI